MQPLPIDRHLDRIIDGLRSERALVLVAPPGAGKTTRVPPALIEDGPVFLLQPRRVAARSLAGRIAHERGWTVGGEVGWQVRFERRFGPKTRLLIATEGVLTARLMRDPLASEFRTVVLDEFHERSVHADLGLALSREALRARSDLRLLVMSATLDATRVARYLGDCPIVEVEGRVRPVQIRHAGDLDMVDAIRQALNRPGGHLLCFLPGAGEIRRTAERLLPLPTLPLHGSLESHQQDAALAPSEARKVILATNIAETSLTVDGVTEVIDGGRQKVMRLDRALGIDRLEVERVSQDAADQRAGRAGRTAPGRALRLWHEREQLRPHREPELQRVDLAGPFLDLYAWGGDPRDFDWFEPPPADTAKEAVDLLERLGAVAQGRITKRGQAMRRIPLSPRLAAVLLDCRHSRLAAAAAAAIAENWRPEGIRPTTACDLLAIADEIDRAPQRVQHAARQLTREPAGPGDERMLRRALFQAYYDRVAVRREPGGVELRLATGHGAVLDRESGVREANWLVAIDLEAGTRGPGSAARVRIASAIDREWLEPTHSRKAHVLDGDRVRATERTYYQELILTERDVEPDRTRAAALLAEAALGRLSVDNQLLLRRLRFAGIEVDTRALVEQALAGSTRMTRIDLAAQLGHRERSELRRLAPESVAIPSGRQARLDYREDGTVVLAVKLQEMFGTNETPRIGTAGEPLTLELLAPNGRPVQTTRDLTSFWQNTYAQVRRELRGRYPKHPWPEDPWAASPTRKTRRRG